MELDLTPGPVFSTILARVRNAQLDAEISDRKQAIELVKTIAAELS